MAVVQREALSPLGIVHPKFSNLLLMNLGAERVKLEYTVFQGKRVRAFLEQAGWPLTWGGSPKALDAELDAARKAAAAPGA